MPRPSCFTPWKDPVPIVQEAGWAPEQSGWVRKISPPLEFDPRTVQPVAIPTELSWPLEQEVLGRKSSLTSSSLAVYIPLVYMCLDTCICMHHPRWLCTFLWFTCVGPDYHIRGSSVNMSDESQKAHDLQDMMLCHSVRSSGCFQVVLSSSRIRQSQKTFLSNNAVET